MRRVACLHLLAAAALAVISSGCGAPIGPSGPAVPHAVTARGALAESEQATIALFQTASPSVVQIVSRTPDLSNLDQETIGSGSGFIWDAQGDIVTNNHVVDAPEIAVRLSTGDVIQAHVVGRAPQYDVAVVRLSRPPNLPPLAIGTSHDLRVGQSVFAIGNPFGLDESLTAGIVSALQRRLPTRDGHEISDVIQTDAAINPGNSGGPLLDSAGRVIGVNTAIFSPSGVNAGIGFAIPIDTVARIVPDLISHGRTPTPGIGVLVANEAVAARLGVEGVLVWRVLPDSPAAHAGMRGTDADANVLGDVIVQANGRPVHRLADLTDQVARAGVGHAIALTVKRGDQTLNFRVGVEDIGSS